MPSAAADLFDRQPSEKSPLDDATLTRVHLFQLLPGPIEIERIDGVDCIGLRRHCLVERNRDAAAAALFAASPTGVIDDDAAHQCRGDREEVSAVLPVHVALSEQLDVGLADYGCRLQAIVPPFAGKMAGGDGAQLVVDERDQTLERVLAALLPLKQRPRDLRPCLFGHECPREGGTAVERVR